MLLQTTKKAASAADVRRIIEDTRGLYKPFGVSTLIYFPEDFKDDQGTLLSGRKLNKKLRNVTRGMLKQKFENRARVEPVKKGGLRVAARKTSEWLRKKHYLHFNDLDLAIIGARLHKGDFQAVSWGSNSGERKLDGAYYKVKDVTKENGDNTVLGYPFTFDLQDYQDNVLSVSREGATKDNLVKPEEVSFCVLWHEIAHGIGAEEAHCDKISAVMCRRHLADSTVLKFESDIRAVNRFAFAQAGVQDKYGWATVEAFDGVLAMKQEDIDAMTEMQIKNIANEKVVQSSAALKHVAIQIGSFNMLLNKKPVGSLSELFTCCTALGMARYNNKKNFDAAFPENKHKEIFDRILTASFRLYSGKNSYQDDKIATVIQQALRIQAGGMNRKI